MVLVQGAMLFSQVGIGTQNPHDSAMLEVAATDKGFLLPRMTSVQRNAISSPESGLQVYDVNTSSIWYFNGLFWSNSQAISSVGEIKSGIELNDHSCLVLLDGRSINFLSANQQAVAISIGLSGNLSNATNSYIVQKGWAIASFSGDNTRTLTHANLPNVNFSRTAASASSHAHAADPGGFWSVENGEQIHGSNTTWGTHGYGWIYANGNMTGNVSQDYTWGEPNLYTTPVGLGIYNSGNHAHWIDVPNTSSSINGAHTHSISAATGRSGTPINIAPMSLTLTCLFI